MYEHYLLLRFSYRIFEKIRLKNKNIIADANTLVK